MSSSGVKNYKGKRKSDERYQESFIPTGLEWKPTQVSNSPHSVDWSMDGSGVRVPVPPFESSSRRTHHRSDVGSQRYTPKRSDAGSERHTPQRSKTGSQHNASDRGQFQRPGKLSTETREEVRDLKRLKVQERINRRIRVLQTRKDRVERRHTRKEQKLQDHLIELERRRQIRIKGENLDLQSGLIYFPTFIELNSKKMKKLKNGKQNLIAQKSILTEPVGKVDDYVNSNPPPANSNSHPPRKDSQPPTGPSLGPDNSRKDNSTDRYNSHSVPPPHQPHSVDSQQTTKPVVSPQTRTSSEKETHKATSPVRGIQPPTLKAQQNYLPFTHDCDHPEQYSPVKRHSPPESTQTRNQGIHHSSPTPRTLSAKSLPGQGLPSPSHSVANHEDLHHPSPMSHQTSSTTTYPSNGPDISRNIPPHQTALSDPSSYITTQPKDTQISSIPHTPNRDSPPHRIPSHPPFSTPPSLDTGDFALKNQLVKMYMTEEDASNPTPEQNQRSEIEFGWLKTAAQKEIQKNRIGSFSPISLSDHLKVQEQTNLMVQELMKEWIGEYTLNKKPIAYIIGDVPFGNIQIAVQPPILIPRPETEQWTCKLSEMIKTWSDSEQTDNKAHFGKKDLKILDIGTGSGCIPTYLAYNHPNLFVMGVDVDENAIELAKRNGFSHGLTFFQRQSLQNTKFKVIQHRGQVSFMNLNLFSSNFVKEVLDELNKKIELRNQELIKKDKDERFDMIISNPPYITKNQYKTLSSSVKNWESILSLIGDKQISLNYQISLKSKTLLNQYKRSTSFNQPIPSSSSSLINSNSSILPKTVTMMQELGLKLPKKIRESLNQDENEGLIRNLEKDDGLDFYKEILNQISKDQILKKSNQNRNQNQLPKILFEVGINQAEDVKRLMINKLIKDFNIISRVEIWKDFSGVDRVVVGF